MWSEDWTVFRSKGGSTRSSKKEPTSYAGIIVMSASVSYLTNIRKFLVLLWWLHLARLYFCSISWIESSEDVAKYHNVLQVHYDTVRNLDAKKWWIVVIHVTSTYCIICINCVLGSDETWYCSSSLMPYIKCKRLYYPETGSRNLHADMNELYRSVLI